MKKQYKYLAYCAPSCLYETFTTIEAARAWLKEGFLTDGEFDPETEDSKIYILHETVVLDVIDKKENYKYLDIDDVPDGEDEDDVWPYSKDWDYVSKERFVPFVEGVS